VLSPELVWFSLLGAFCFGLAYYRFVLLPASRDAQFEGSINAFSRAVELRFPNHAGLTDVVAQLARRVGKAMGFGPTRLQKLERSVRLRDVGLCAIPYQLVNRRSWEDWTLSEMATYECHADVGAAILETIPTLAEHAPTVRDHHAPFRSPASPSDMRAPSLEARIAKATVEFVWYWRHRGYDAAIRQLTEGSGTVFDPQVVPHVLSLAQSMDLNRQIAAREVN